MGRIRGKRVWSPARCLCPAGRLARPQRRGVHTRGGGGGGFSAGCSHCGPRCYRRSGLAIVTIATGPGNKCAYRLRDSIVLRVTYRTGI